MSVTVSSAEALRILDFAEANEPDTLDKVEQRIGALGEPSPAPDVALNRLLDLGPCSFLSGDGLCAVYPVRPDACRACLVWHPPEFCGREDFDMATPSELNERRVDVVYGCMLAEIDAGRRPFWGQLAPMVWALRAHRRAYLDGVDLSHVIEERWQQSELIEFPRRGGALADIRAYLESERESLRGIFEQEPSPMGFPRASEAPNRDYLAAFPLD